MSVKILNNPITKHTTQIELTMKSNNNGSRANFTMTPNAVLYDKALSGNEFKVWTILWSSHPTFVPSCERISEVANMSICTAKRVLKALVEKEYLEVCKEPETGKRTYAVKVPDRLVDACQESMQSIISQVAPVFTNKTDGIKMIPRSEPDGIKMIPRSEVDGIKMIPRSEVDGIKMIPLLKTLKKDEDKDKTLNIKSKECANILDSDPEMLPPKLEPPYNDPKLQADPGYVQAISSKNELERASARVWARYKLKYPSGLSYTRSRDNIYPLLHAGRKEEQLLSVLAKSRGMLDTKPWEVFGVLRDSTQDRFTQQYGVNYNTPTGRLVEQMRKMDPETRQMFKECYMNTAPDYYGDLFPKAEKILAEEEAVTK